MNPHSAQLLVTRLDIERLVTPVSAHDMAMRCQTLVGSAQQQATGLAAGSWPRAKQLKVFV